MRRWVGGLRQIVHRASTRQAVRCFGPLVAGAAPRAAERVAGSPGWRRGRVALHNFSASGSMVGDSVVLGWPSPTSCWGGDLKIHTKRIEGVIDQLKDLFALERHRAKTLSGLLTCLAARSQPTPADSVSIISLGGRCATWPTFSSEQLHIIRPKVARSSRSRGSRSRAIFGPLKARRALPRPSGVCDTVEARWGSSPARQRPRRKVARGGGGRQRAGTAFLRELAGLG